jgi:hypothetical protein
MNHLKDICSGSGDFNSMTLDQLRQQCQNAGQAFGLTWVEIVLLILGMVAALIWLLWSRIHASEDAGIVVGNAFEGVLYAAIGMVAGSGFGLWAAEIVPPHVLGAILLLTGIAALVFVILGVIHGNGDASGKVGAVLLGLLLAAAVAVVGGLGLAVPGSGAAGHDYERYLNAVAISVGVLGALDGIIAALLRGPHWAVGWLLVFVNSSWGFIGNILGLGTHLGSYLTGANHGGVVDTNRVAYTLYQNGMTTLIENGQRFAFTQGWVMSCGGTADLVKHEGVHVGQHFVLGPIYILSHAVWDALGIVIGLFGAFFKWITHLDDPSKQVNVKDAVTNVMYYDNPYEIMAYMVPHGIRDSKLNEPFVLDSPWSFILMVVWILAAIATFIALMVHWT